MSSRQAQRLLVCGTLRSAVPGRVIDGALVGALTDLIVPGLQQLGMSTAPLEAWIESGAGTEVAPVELLKL